MWLVESCAYGCLAFLLLMVAMTPGFSRELLVNASVVGTVIFVGFLVSQTVRIITEIIKSLR